MARVQAGTVSVIRAAKQGDLGGKDIHTWANNVRVDRKGTLHVYGENRQHLTYTDGQWTAYVVTPPKRERYTGFDDDA